MPNEIITQRHPEDVIEALLILLSPKREEEYIDETNEDDGGVGGDDVGGGEVVVKEEEVKEEEVEEVVVGVKRKAEEETKPRKTKKKGSRNGHTNPWTKKEEDALLKGAGKYGMDWKRIKKEDDGKVLADRTPAALYIRLKRQYPEKLKEARAVTPSKVIRWTKEEDDALKRGVEVHGNDWEKIIFENDVLERRTPAALQVRYSTHLK